MRNYAWIDVETTGLSVNSNDIVQLALIPVVDGVEQEPFNEYCQPRNWTSIAQEAIAVHGITEDQMKTFQMPSELLDKLIARLRIYNTKFVIAGFNINFDKSFLGAFFAKDGKSRAYSELFTSETHDTYARAKSVKDKLKSSRFKLEILAQEFGIDIYAHEALSDIRATIQLDKEISKLIGDEEDIVLEKDITVSIDLPEPAHLHLHSEFSTTDSIVKMEEWLAWALKKGVRAVAFPDHYWSASLYKAINYSKLFNKINTTTGCNWSAKDISVIPAISLTVSAPDLCSSNFNINVYATSNEGYHNLIKLSTIGWKTTTTDCEVVVPVVDLHAIKQHMAGLVFSSADEKGLIGQLILQGASTDLILDKIKALSHSLGSLYLELLTFDIIKQFKDKVGFCNLKKTPALPTGNLAEQINLTVAAANKAGLPILISTAANFIDPNDKVLQDVVSRSNYKDGRTYYESRHQRSVQECFTILKRQLGPWMTEAKWHEAVDNSYAIVESVNVNIKHEYHLPKIAMPDNIQAKTDDYDQQLYYLLMAKIKQHGRWSDDPVYIERFKREIDVIWKNKRLNFMPYFLMYEDICTYARSQGIVQGISRGSAGGCLVAYYLKIIHINPVEQELPFERFLSIPRIDGGSFPDFDTDFGQREQILAYLMEKYQAGFAQIGTVQSYKTKNAIKEAMFAIFGRARNDKEVCIVTDTIPDSPQGLEEYKFLYGYTDTDGITHKGQLEINDALVKFFDQYPEVADIVKRLIGLPKGMGRHASGFVISTLDLSSDRVPLALFDDAKLGKIWVTQFEAKMVEGSGLVKADILGVTAIKTITEAMLLIKARTGLDLFEEDTKGVQAIYRLPEDEGVYKDFYNRKTDSSFQFNTDLIKSFAQSFAPSCRKDLANLTALARPGALGVEFKPGVSATHFYINVRNGKSKPEYIHPDLEPTLRDTYGVIAYQEQLMNVLVAMCGYSLEEADQIRSAIAKKKRDVMTKAFERVRTYTVTRGWTIEQANKLCDVLIAYADYSFNKSHACAYGELGYITLWLKHNYPLEWWSAVLNNSEEKKLRYYVSVLGDLVAPPSVNTPSYEFKIAGNKIAAPLTSIKGFGPAAMRAVVKNGPFKNINDFVGRIGSQVRADHFGALIKARALDCIMDSAIPYKDARIKLIEDFCHLRKLKKLNDDSVYQTDALSIFINERDSSKTFNKELAQDPDMYPVLHKQWPALTPTKRKSVPLMMGSVNVISGVRSANAILTAHTDDDGDGIEIGMIGLFVSSSHRNGISKKNGRRWRKVEMILSDGSSDIECIWWDRDKALRFQKDTVVYVHGKLKQGWRGLPQISIIDVERIK